MKSRLDILFSLVLSFYVLLVQKHLLCKSTSLYVSPYCPVLCIGLRPAHGHFVASFLSFFQTLPVDMFSAAELQMCQASYSLRRRVDRLIKQISAQLAKINYPCLHDELIAIATTTTVQPCLFYFAIRRYISSDTNQGGFLFFYWLLHLGDKWIIDSLADSLQVHI